MMDFAELPVVSLTKQNGATFTGNARVILLDGNPVLQSYRTIVAFIRDGKLHRTWDGRTMTTSRHIGMFVDAFAPELRRAAESSKFRTLGKYFESLPLEKAPVTIYATRA